MLNIGRRVYRVEISVNVRSGCRCFAHNANEGGSDNSYHCPGPERLPAAADIELLGLPLNLTYYCAMGWAPFREGGIGLYLPSEPDEDGKTVGGPPRIHVDARGYKARWGYIGDVKTPFEKVLASAKERGL